MLCLSLSLSLSGCMLSWLREHRCVRVYTQLSSLVNFRCSSCLVGLVVAKAITATTCCWGQQQIGSVGNLSVLLDGGHRQLSCSERAKQSPPESELLLADYDNWLARILRGNQTAEWDAETIQADDGGGSVDGCCRARAPPVGLVVWLCEKN